MRLLLALVSLLRAATAALLVWVCLQALPAWDARAAFLALPDYDYWAQADGLRAGERYSEALLVVDAGLAVETDPFPIARLYQQRDLIVTERDDWMRRLGDVGEGALTGTGRSIEALGGAVVADLFVFGDVRDLVIQGSRKLRGEDTDDVIVALSAAGLLLTAAPAADLGTALLKFSRRMGAITERFAAQLLRTARSAVDQRDAAPLLDLAGDAATLGRRAQPAAAVAILKRVDDPQALKTAARLSEQPGGSFALWVGGRPALQLAQSGTLGEALLLRAARKGQRGVEFAADHARLLTGAHPLLGLIKGVYKHNLPQLLVDLLGHHAIVVLGLLAGWLAFELLLSARRLGLAFTRRKPPERPEQPAMGRQRQAPIA